MVIFSNSVTSTFFNDRVFTWVRRSPRADTNNLCIARSQIHLLLTCILLFCTLDLDLALHTPIIALSDLRRPSHAARHPVLLSTALDVVDAKSRIGDPTR
jgi:hypothetical protein